VSKKRRLPENSPVPRSRIRRGRALGALMVGVVYLPLLAAKLYPLTWHWFGSVVFDYGELLSVLPGAVLTVLFAPRVGYRRRDALMLLFPPSGIRLAGIIGTRMGRLPYRDWPTRTDGIPVQGRQAARIAVAVDRYRSWRQGRAGQLTGSAEPGAGPATTGELTASRDSPAG
jgi:hypothetical protein